MWNSISHSHGRIRLNGKQLISVYHDYLQTLDEKKLELLFLHNYEDVLGMGSVLELLALPALFHGDFSVQSCRFTGQTLEVSLQPEREVPVFLSVSARMVLLQPLVHGFLSPCRRIRRS